MFRVSGGNDSMYSSTVANVAMLNVTSSRQIYTAVDGGRFAGTKHPDVDLGRDPAGVLRESIAGLHQRGAPEVVEPRRIERAPMDRDRHGRPDVDQRLRCRPRSEV